MSEERQKADWPIVAALVLAVVVLPLAVYFGGYFRMGGLGTISNGRETKKCRVYSAQWQMVVFRPAAQVESFLTGEEIETAHIPNPIK